MKVRKRLKNHIRNRNTNKKEEDGNKFSTLLQALFRELQKDVLGCGGHGATSLLDTTLFEPSTRW